MNLFENLKYVGNGILSIYDTYWHCTNYVTNYKTGEMQYILQPPYKHDGIFLGYNNMDAYVLTEDELIENFKIVSDNGDLKDIEYNESCIQEELDKFENDLISITDEQFKSLLNGSK